MRTVSFCACVHRGAWRAPLRGAILFANLWLITCDQQRLRALQNDRQLARFVLEGRATGKQLGTGSYGSVEEVKGRNTSKEKWSGAASTQIHPISRLLISTFPPFRLK